MEENMPTENEKNVNAIYSILKKHFKRHMVRNNNFVCHGGHEFFRIEIDFFSNLGWSLIDKSDNVGCLMILINNEIVNLDVGLYVSSLSNPDFIVINTGNEKKTPIYAKLELAGYRLLFEAKEVSYLYLPFTSQQIVAENFVLGDVEVGKLLGISKRKVRKLAPDTKVSHILISARELLCARRFDIAIKHIYARLYLLGGAKSWREYVYYEQAVRITGGGGELIEFDGTGKSGIDVFLKSFQGLLAEIDPFDIPAIPIDKNLLAYDGSHRISAAIATNRLISCVKINDEARNCADYKFFRSSKYGHHPCPDVILDEAALEYCGIKDTAAIVFIFPSVVSEDAAIKEILTFSEIVYRKDLYVTSSMAEGLLKQIYLGQPWLQEEGESSGFIYKCKSCFPHRGMMRVLLIDSFDQKQLRVVKERVRDIYKIGSHSIHVTDTWDETLRAARIIFNIESFRVLGIGIKPTPEFHRRLFEYRDWLDSNNIDYNSVCIDGSYVVSLLGLREARDLDFLYIGDERDLPNTPEKIDCHNACVEKYCDIEVQDIVLDPRNHFWYMGLKFCIPEIVKKMKSQRNTEKDRLDVILLASVLAKKKKNNLVVNKIGMVLRVYVYIRFMQLKILRHVKIRLRSIFLIMRKINRN